MQGDSLGLHLDRPSTMLSLSLSIYLLACKMNRLVLGITDNLSTSDFDRRVSKNRGLRNGVPRATIFFTNVHHFTDLVCSRPEPIQEPLFSISGDESSAEASSVIFNFD
jgi:hypothetical protein